jgi:hypothetical protein
LQVFPKYKIVDIPASIQTQLWTSCTANVAFFSSLDVCHFRWCTSQEGLCSLELVAIAAATWQSSASCSSKPLRCFIYSYNRDEPLQAVQF